MEKYKLINFKHGKLYHHKEDKDSLIEIIKKTGEYQSWIINQAKHFITKRKNKGYQKNVIIDIGANIGVMTIPFSKLANEVHSFEPVSSTFKNLEINIKENKLENVNTHQIALGEQKEKRDIYFKPSKSGASSFFLTLSKKETVEIETLDSYEIQDIALIKIDVQGSEVEVLNGAKNTIKRTKCPIIVEIVERNNEEIQFATKIKDFFKKINYSMKDKKKKDALFIYDKGLAK